MKKISVFVFLCLVCFSCKEKQTVFNIETKEMSDAEYPDNPNLESRHSEAKQKYFKNIILNENKADLFDLNLYSHEEGLCKITLKSLPLLEMIPTAPDYIKKDDYLTYIGVINQEWNRQQVQFKKGQFEVSGKTNTKITRVDLARNCLNAYLWEVLVYAEDVDGEEKLFWQCWFDFPKDLYKNLFEKRNKLSYETFREGLENWKDPETKRVDLSILRKVNTENEVSFEAFNDKMYPISGERERKKKNIIFPINFTKIKDLLSDSTLFATFSIPGYYNTQDPRKTELSRLGILQKVVKREIVNALGIKSLELELIFVSNKDHATQTKFVIGGIDPTLIPTLDEEKLNKGFQTSMGIANHSFYETLDYQQKHLTRDNAFYAFLLDKDNQWIDSHKIGIDGPLFYFDTKDKTKLHLWILSFERHAFVGHYVIKL